MKIFVQNGFVLVAIVVAAIVTCITVMLLIEPSSQSDKIVAIAIMLVVSLFVVLTSYKMVIVIDQETLFFSMGIGLIRKTIYLSDISECAVVRRKKTGISVAAHARIYNVGFGGMIKISMKNTKMNYFLGSNCPYEIKETIDNAIKALGEKRRNVNYY